MAHGIMTSSVRLDKPAGSLLIPLTNCVMYFSPLVPWRMLINSTLTCVSLLIQVAIANAQVRDGTIRFALEQLQPGHAFDLTGQWLYKPGYAVAPDEKPELASQAASFIPVPVPQLLNRIHWWL